MTRLKCPSPPMIRRKSRESGYDQTQVHSDPPIISALEATYDQTQVRSNPPMIRLKCTQIRLLSDSSALESPYDQTQVLSNPPII